MHMNFPRATALLALFSLSTAPAPLSAQARNSTFPEGVLELATADVRVGILPAAAGRVVYFGSLSTHDNLLKGHLPDWENAARKLPPPEKWDIGDIELHGHMIWVAPQAEFWNQQEIRPEKKGATWPPDPWSEVAPYKVVARDSNSITLQGPVSPVTGLQMTKHYLLTPKGRLELTVEATNRRETPVTWALWSVTRFPAQGSIYALYDPAHEPRIKDRPPSGEELPAFAYKMDDGLFSLTAEADQPGERRPGRKAFIELPKGGPTTLVYLRCTVALLKSFEATPQEKIAPGESSVQLFADRALDDGGKLELEFQGPVQTLPPGESLELTETWEIRRLNGAPLGDGAGKIVRGLMAE